MKKSKLFLSILIFGTLLSIALPKNSTPFYVEAEESSTTQETFEFSTSCMPLNNCPNDN